MTDANERRRAVVLAALVALSAIAIGVGPIGAVASDGDYSADAGVSGQNNVQQQEGGTLSGETNLSNADVTIRGDGADDRLGASIAPAGDVDGDGNDDVIVGAPFNNSTDTRSGAAYLFTGPVEDGEYDAADADLTLRGESASDWAGYSVASGDVNGDGDSDLIVGAPLHDDPDNDAGAVYVVYGAADMTGTMNLSDADVKLTGAEAGDQFGLSVAAVDPNDDGTDAVAVGAPRNDGAGQNAGAAYTFEIDGDVMLSATDADATMRGESAGDRAGQAVANGGDVNGDGAADILVGAPFNNSTASNAGAAYAVIQADGESSLADAAVKMSGESSGDLAGWSLSDAGDVNGDGVGDVVVGAPFNDSTGASAGAAYVVHGGDLPSELNLGDADVRLAGEDDGDRAGWSVSSAGSGDVTCDEYDDVLVGAPFSDSNGNEHGSAYLVYGGENLAENRSLETAEATLHGEGAGDRAGIAVSDVNDTSGDGNEDIAVGATRNDSDAENSGAAYIVNGQCPVEGEEEPEKTTEEPTDTETPTETTEQTTKDTTERTTEDTTEQTTEETTTERTTTEQTTTQETTERTTKETTTERTTTEQTTTKREDEPKGADITVECVDGVPTITIENANQNTGITVTFVQIADYNLDPGESRTFSIGGLQGTLTVETYVSGQNSPIASETFDLDSLDCGDDDEPQGVDITTQCVDGQGEITVTNPNDEEVTVTVYDSNGNSVAGATIQAGDSETFDNLDDDTYEVETVDIVSPGAGAVIATESVEIDCDEDDGEQPEQPDISITPQCLDDGSAEAEITLNNPDAVEYPVNVQLKVQGDVVGAVTFEEGDDASQTVALDLTAQELEEGRVVNVFANDERLSDLQFTIQCDQPEPEPEQPDISIDYRCLDDGSAEADVTLNNPDAVEYPVNVQLKVQGEVVGEVTFEEGGDTTQTTDIALSSEALEDSRVINVFANDERLSDLQFEIQCDQPEPEPEQPDISIDYRCLDDGSAVVDVTLNNPDAVEYPVNVQLKVQGDVVGAVTFEEGDDATQTTDIALSGDELEDGGTVNVFVNGDRQGDLQFEIQCDQGAGECPTGPGELLVKYDNLDQTSESQPMNWVVEGDYENAVSITITEWDEDNEVEELTFQSNVGPVEVVASGGGNTVTMTAESGTISASDLGGHAISNVEFRCPSNG